MIELWGLEDFGTGWRGTVATFVITRPICCGVIGGNLAFGMR